MLNDHGFKATCECNYSRSNRRCDVIVDVGWGMPVWIEMKGAWRAYFDPPKPNTKYRAHLEATAKDMQEKLESLTESDASAVSLVLIGFDKPERHIFIDETDLAQIENFANTHGWRSAYSQWNVNMSLIFRTRCWIWSRQLTVPEIVRKIESDTTNNAPSKG
jgi:hypothetical protein